MLPADPSKVMLSSDFLICPAAKSTALDLIDRLEQSQICLTSGSKTPQCIHTKHQFGKLPIDQNSFYRLKAAHPGTEKSVGEKKWVQVQSFLTVLYEGGFQTEILLCGIVKEGLRRYKQNC